SAPANVSATAQMSGWAASADTSAPGGRTRMGCTATRCPYPRNRAATCSTTASVREVADGLPASARILATNSPHLSIRHPPVRNAEFFGPAVLRSPPGGAIPWEQPPRSNVNATRGLITYLCRFRNSLQKGKNRCCTRRAGTAPEHTDAGAGGFGEQVLAERADPGVVTGRHGSSRVGEVRGTRSPDRLGSKLRGPCQAECSSIDGLIWGSRPRCPGTGATTGPDWRDAVCCGEAPRRGAASTTVCGSAKVPNAVIVTAWATASNSSSTPRLPTIGRIAPPPKLRSSTASNA